MAAYKLKIENHISICGI